MTGRESGLERVRRDVTAGNLGRARDRLHGLLATHPNDLRLRGELARIYAKLGFPAMAGRYWYLEALPDPEMQAACREFERSCGHDPLRMLLALKFKGDIGRLEACAQERLLALQNECARRHPYYPEFGLRGRERWKTTPGEIGCAAGGIAATIALVGLALIGLWTVIGWLEG